MQEKRLIPLLEEPTSALFRTPAAGMMLFWVTMAPESIIPTVRSPDSSSAPNSRTAHISSCRTNCGSGRRRQTANIPSTVTPGIFPELHPLRRKRNSTQPGRLVPTPAHRELTWLDMWSVGHIPLFVGKFLCGFGGSCSEHSTTLIHLGMCRGGEHIKLHRTLAG